MEQETANALAIAADYLRVGFLKQEEMNSMINPDWRNQGNDWKLAATLEAAELIDHLDWKWWKKQEGDLAEARVEIVDIFHFLLSEQLQRTNKHSLQTTVDKLAMDYLSCERNANPNNAPGLINLTKIFMHSLLSGGLPWGIFFEMILATNMSLKGMVLLYLAKNTLNHFRQLNGYKEGTYQKNWEGKEDNTVMLELLETMDWVEGELDFFEADLMKLLAIEYGKVTGEDGAIKPSLASPVVDPLGLDEVGK